MIKSENNYILSWTIIIIVLVTTIITNLLAGSLKGSIKSSDFLWLIYFNIPVLIGIICAICINKKLIGTLSFKIEISKWYRYFYFLIIITGLIFFSASIGSTIKPHALLLMLTRINIVTRDFSDLFYIKILLLSPVIEELIFRGIILDGFLSRYSTRKAILLSSLFFSVLHFSPLQILYTFILGIFCGWYYSRTRNLLSCIIIHFLNNLIGIIVIKHFFDEMHFQAITSDTRFFHFEHLWVVILLSLASIFVGIISLTKTMNSGITGQRWYK